MIAAIAVYWTGGFLVGAMLGLALSDYIEREKRRTADAVRFWDARFASRQHRTNPPGSPTSCSAEVVR